MFPVPLAVADGNFQEEKWCNYENYNAHIHTYIYILYIIPVVPHKAVAEVSKIGNL